MDRPPSSSLNSQNETPEQIRGGSFSRKSSSTSSSTSSTSPTTLVTQQKKNILDYKNKINILTKESKIETSVTGIENKNKNAKKDVKTLELNIIALKVAQEEQKQRLLLIKQEEKKLADISLRNMLEDENSFYM